MLWISSIMHFLVRSLYVLALQDFCTGLVQGTLKPYFKSQTIPDNVSSYKPLLVLFRFCITNQYLRDYIILI